MDALLSQTLYIMFVLTGLVACLNAWLGKWGPALCMLCMSFGAVTAGSVLGGSLLWLAPAFVIVAALVGLWISAPDQGGSDSQTVPADDPKTVSDRRLAEMNAICAEKRRQRRCAHIQGETSC